MRKAVREEGSVTNYSLFVNHPPKSPPAAAGQVFEGGIRWGRLRADGKGWMIGRLGDWENGRQKAWVSERME